MGLKESTVRTWFAHWRRLQEKTAKTSVPKQNKKTKTKTAVPKQQTKQEVTPVVVPGCRNPRLRHWSAREGSTVKTEKGNPLLHPCNAAGVLFTPARISYDIAYKNEGHVVF
jgi:hypothetical protein